MSRKDTPQEAAASAAAPRPPQPQGPCIVYLFTTFPKATETFLQREILAMQARGLRLHIYSFWGGGGDFHGLQVTRFNFWRLFELLWVLPWVWLRHPRTMGRLTKGLFSRRAPSWLNFWENMLGAGFAALFSRELRRVGPDWIHAAWSGAPATAAWILRSFDGHGYSCGAHAYDLYEHGGDWWLDEKLSPAAFIHTSTEMGRATLIARGVDPAKVHCIRRGLPAFPELSPLRATRDPLRILCIARLVAKKGLHLQLAIYDALSEAGIAFEARIVGDGELAEALEAEIERRGLVGLVTLTGHLPQEGVREQLLWADVLVHTGIVAPSGDRDGLPNVIPEAMASGVLVVSSPEAATTEAISDGITGLLADPRQPAEWVAALRRLRDDSTLCARLQAAARAWTLENYDAHKNAARLHTLFLKAIEAGQTQS